LHGLAERSTLSQARLHIADARRFNPQTIMPAYLSTEGLHNVAAGLKGQTVLTPQALEDILSYLFQPTARTPVIAP
jgi:sulfur-oxidizing protein SoxX